MSEPQQQACALWYFRHFCPVYYLARDEAEAAGAAVSLLDYGEGNPIGVQFPDGRLIRRENWPEFAAARARAEAEHAEHEARRAAGPPEPPARRALDPFDGQALMIPADDPAWLGRPT